MLEIEKKSLSLSNKQTNQQTLRINMKIYFFLSFKSLNYLKMPWEIVTFTYTLTLLSKQVGPNEFLNFTDLVFLWQHGGENTLTIELHCYPIIKGEHHKFICSFDDTRIKDYY